MKKIAIVLLICLIAIASEQEAKVHFSEHAVGKDRYGRTLYEANITAILHNYPLHTLLARPVKESGKVAYKKGYVVNMLTTSAVVQIAVDGDSPVYDENESSGLESIGGSGQRPFLLSHDALHKTASFTAWFIPVDKSGSFVSESSEDVLLYPLDVQRDAKYTSSGNVSACKGFFGFFTCFFDTFFGEPIGVTFFGSAETGGIDYPIKRQKYLANIFYGIDKPHLLSQEDSVDTTTPASNTPLSLLHYSEMPANGCYTMGGFFNFGSDSLVCKFIKTFAMDKWMPFVAVSEDDSLAYERIEEDTKITLMALMGYKEELPHAGSLFGSFWQEMFKPMNFMLSIFFPNDSDNLSKVVEREINATNPSIVILPIVSEDGNTIEQLQSFKLQGLQYALAKEVMECQKLKFSFFGPYWDDVPLTECKDKIDDAIDTSFENRDATLLENILQGMWDFFSIWFGNKYKITTVTHTRLGLVLEPYTPTLEDGNPLYEGVQHFSQTGSMQ